jgi:hypothetical protein
VSSAASPYRAGRAAARMALCWLALALAAAPALGSPPGSAQKQKSRDNKKDYSYALLFGTVFNGEGRLVRDAQVRVRQKDGKKRWEAASDGQGEFAVHLPPGAAVYLVEVSAPGLQTESKEIAFSGDERQNVVFRLSGK